MGCADHGKALKAFLDNSKLIKQRKNGNYLYHEVLSFSPEDSGALNFAILEDLTMKYLDLRTKGKGLAYAGVHWGKNPHVHIMLSANEFGSSRKLNLSRAEFLRVGRDVERYQRENYPFLKSIVRGLPWRGRAIQKTRGESERERRLKRGGHSGGKTGRQSGITQKTQASELVTKSLNQAESFEELERILLENGLEIYRRGQTFGVREIQSGRKYRLKTLGVLGEFERCVERWERVARREIAIDRIKAGKVTSYNLAQNEYILCR